MKQIDEILSENNSFEPTQKTKKSILKAIRMPNLTHQIGVYKHVIPSFYSYNVNKYNEYIYAVVLLYALELYAAASIILTSASFKYTIVKIILVAILIIIDIFIAKSTNSKDDELCELEYQNSLSKLTRLFFNRYLSFNELHHIETGINDNNKSIKKIQWFSRKKLIGLYIIACLKIVIFLGDYIMQWFGWGQNVDSIFSHNFTFVFLFFSAPAVYLIIPIIAWGFYGKWITTGNAYTSLENELIGHKDDISLSRSNIINPIRFCNSIKNDSLLLNILVSNIKEVLSIDNGVIEINEIFEPRFNNDEGQNYRIYSSNVDDPNSWKIEIRGIITDTALLNMVAQQTDSNAKKLLLCLGMSYQILNSNSQPEVLTHEEFFNQY
jgi:hypothetical protein